MSSQIRSLLAGKFIALSLVIFLTFIVIIKRQDNINNSNQSNASTSLAACIVLSLACQFSVLLGMLTKFSIFFDKINVFSIVFLSIGVLFTSWFILGK